MPWKRSFFIKHFFQCNYHFLQNLPFSSNSKENFRANAWHARIQDLHIKVKLNQQPIFAGIENKHLKSFISLIMINLPKGNGGQCTQFKYHIYLNILHQIRIGQN